MIAEEQARAVQIAPAAEMAAQRRTPSRARYDLVILGGGSAGLSAATLAATLRAKVALIDRERLGGECLYTGCVPSKALLHVARVAWGARNAAALGLSARLDPVEFTQVARYVHGAIGEVYAESDAAEHYIAQGVDVLFGEARFTGRDSLSVNGQRISARRFLLATGSQPAIPDIPGLREAGYLTNETIFAARALPQRLLVIGGGPIGVELGQAFARLGSQVTIAQRGGRLIPKEEPTACDLLRARLADEGVTILTHAAALRVESRDGEKMVTLRVGEGAGAGAGERVVACDEILVCVGRRPAVEGLGLEAAGVRVGPRGVEVDGYLATSNPRVYAAGDVTGGLAFTHAAAAQARVAARNALIPIRARLDERVTPWATFTEPEIARVGLTEAEARKAHGDDVWATTLPLASVDRAITDDAAQGFITLVATRRGKLLGATVAGEAGGEIINELAVAMRAGLTLAQLAATTHVYPTVALGVQQAAGAFSLERTRRSGLVRFLRALAR